MNYITRMDDKGYIDVLTDDGWIAEHRLVTEKFIGRPLKKEEVVHHISGNKQDNRISNLMLFPNQKDHASFHIKFKKFGLNNSIKRQITFRWKEYKNRNGEAVSHCPHEAEMVGSTPTSDIFDYEKHTGFSKPIWEAGDLNG